MDNLKNPKNRFEGPVEYPRVGPSRPIPSTPLLPAPLETLCPSKLNSPLWTPKPPTNDDHEICEDRDPNLCHSGQIRSPFSIRKLMADQSILITGATGYLGSVALEQLLRGCPDIRRIFLLCRSRGAQSAQQRIDRLLLRSGLFKMLRSQENAAIQLAKVRIVEGDISEVDLGLNAADLDVVLRECTTIIHGAARIALEDPLDTTLRNNYFGTAHVLDLADKIGTFRPGQLQAFVHVSTAFVNLNLPHETNVQERIYPLKFGDREISHARVVHDLLSMPPRESRIRSALLCRTWGFTNTYALGKHLTEQLVDGRRRLNSVGGAAVAIVRPSLVSAVAGLPYPGFVGNLAGPTGVMTAFALGFFCKDSFAWHSHHILDSVPGDVAAAVIIAGAAAAIELKRRGLGARCDGEGGGLKSGVGLGVGLGSAGVGGSGGSSIVAKDSKDSALESVLPQGMARNPSPSLSFPSSSLSSALPSPALPLLVLHAASDCVNPFMHLEAYMMAYRFFSRHKLPFRLGRYFLPKSEKRLIVYEPTEERVKWAKKWTCAKVSMAATALRCLGKTREARKLKVGYQAWDQANSLKYDKTLFFSVDNVVDLESRQPEDERVLFPLVWRGDWLRFGNTYMAGACRLFLKLPVPPRLPDEFLDHDFTFIPEEKEGEGASLAAAIAAAAAAAAAATATTSTTTTSTTTTTMVMMGESKVERKQLEKEQKEDESERRARAGAQSKKEEPWDGSDPKSEESEEEKKGRGKRNGEEGVENATKRNSSEDSTSRGSYNYGKKVREQLQTPKARRFVLDGGVTRGDLGPMDEVGVAA